MSCRPPLRRQALLWEEGPSKSSNSNQCQTAKIKLEPQIRLECPNAVIACPLTQQRRFSNCANRREFKEAVGVEKSREELFQKVDRKWKEENSRDNCRETRSKLQECEKQNRSSQQKLLSYFQKSASGSTHHQQFLLIAFVPISEQGQQ